MLKAATLILAIIATTINARIAFAANAPVELVSCRMAMAMPSVLPEQPGPFIAGVQAVFMNHAPSAATEVDLKVTAIYKTQLITIKGTFTPGVRIDKFLSDTVFTGLNYFRDEPDECAIVRVKLADGSAWMAPHT
jgi:hypothetical protein